MLKKAIKPFKDLSLLMKILIFTTDLPPLPGKPTSGTALRTYNLAEGLKEIGHDVILSVPKSALDAYELSLNKDEKSKSKNIKDQIRELRSLSFDTISQARRISEVSPDLIICGHWPAWTLGRKPAQPLIIDLAGPHLLERHFQGDDNSEDAVLGKLNALSSADYFIVSGNKQRLYFLSFLLRAQIPMPEKRICTIPMPLPEPEDRFTKSALKVENDNKYYPRFIFGGVFLPWQDPSWGLKTISEELLKRSKGSLTLVGGKHPHYDINSGQYDELFKEIELNQFVNRYPLLPYEDFLDLLPHADIALDLMSWNLERELAITIRTTTYLWAGIPIIYNDYADLSEHIKTYDAGWCIKPGDRKAFTEVMDEIYSNPEIVRIKSKNALRLANELFNRKESAKKILTLLDLPSVPVNEEIDVRLDIPESCDLSFKPESILEQRFTCRIDGLNKIELLFGTHGDTLNGSLEVELFEVNNTLNSNKDFKPLLRKTMEASEIKNNTWISLEVPRVELSAGKVFALRLKKHGSNMDLLSPWIMKSSPYPASGLYQDGKLLGINSLCMKTHSIKGSPQI